MKINVILPVIFIVMTGLSACGSSSAPSNVPAAGEKADSAVEKEAPSDSNKGKKSGTTSGSCEKTIPASLVEAIAGKAVPVWYTSESDTSCLALFGDDKNSKTKMVLTFETQADMDFVKRKVFMFKHIPGFVEEFGAGDGAVLSRHTEKTVDIITVLFSIGHTGCSIVTQIPTGEDAGKGLLFSYDDVKKLAFQWADHLKSLQK